MLAILLSATLFTAPSIWVSLGRTASRDQAAALRARVKGGDQLGNSLHNYLIVMDEEAETLPVRLVVGPFTTKSTAFQFGYRHLSEGRVSSFSITGLDGAPLSLKMRRSQRKRLLKGCTPPYPTLGIVLNPTTLGWNTPTRTIGARKTAAATLGYRDEVWLLQERSLCVKGNCHRWFQGLTPRPHRLLWFQAGHVVPLRSVRSVRDAKGKRINYTAVTHIGKRGRQILYMALRFMPRHPPYRHLFLLPRLFYLKLSRDKVGKWKAVDRRGIEQYQLSTYSQWRPVSTLFRRHRRSTFFQ